MENVLVPDCLPVVGKKNCPSVRPSTPSVWLVADRPVQCFVALLLVQAVATVTNRHTHTLNLDPIASQSADPHVLFLVVVNIFLLWPVVISPRFVGRGSRFLAVPSRFVVFVIRRVRTIMMHTSFRSCRINTRPTPLVPPNVQGIQTSKQECMDGFAQFNTAICLPTLSFRVVIRFVGSCLFRNGESVSIHARNPHHGTQPGRVQPLSASPSALHPRPPL